MLTERIMNIINEEMEQDGLLKYVFIRHTNK